MEVITPINRFNNHNNKPFMAITTVTKYPIFFSSLITRIEDLKYQYKYTSTNYIFDLSKDMEKIKVKLKSKGGVYILWCKSNGMFYVGSTIQFVSKSGRLADYIRISTAQSMNCNKYKSVNTLLANSINKYKIGDFILIIPEIQPSNTVTIADVRKQEQFYMLLNPTFNATLNVVFPAYSHSDKKIMTRYHYFQSEVYKNSIIPNSQKKIFGLKGVSSVISKSGDHYPIEYNTLKGYLKTGIIWNEKFVFTKEKPENNSIVYNQTIVSSKSGKIQPI